MKAPRQGEAINDRVCLVYSQKYQINFGGLEKLHAFDINKYAKIYLRLLSDGLIRPDYVFVPESISESDILRVHTREYLAALQEPAKLARYLEFGPIALSPAALSDAAVLSPFRYATGGTLLAARLALKHGVAINLGGGYHHAEPDRGGGFCIYADMPIALRVLQAEGLIRRALVVDLDVHQGNGTALCVAPDNDIFTFDMHEDDIYPHPKQRNDLDVPLPSGLGDDEYLKILRANLPGVFDRAKPDIVIYQSGVDSLDGDPLAHLRMTPEGIIERDRVVFAAAIKRNIPIVLVLGGGYSSNAWFAQYSSIRNIIEEFGGETNLANAPRKPTLHEKVYTK